MLDYITVTASVPVQNQVAAQKLLQKTSLPNFSDRNSRFQRRRGKDKEEDDSSLITLEEWERRKTGTNLRTTHEQSHSSRDEDLARQLQEQFDLEDNHVTIFCRSMSYGVYYSYYVDRLTKPCFFKNCVP